MSDATQTDKDYKGKLLRLFRQIMLLYRTPIGLSITEMAEKLGVSYRTIYRDLEVLKEVGFFPEEVKRGKFVIRGVDQEVAKFEKNLQFTAEEAGILSRAVSSIPDSHPIRKQILEKLLTFSGMEDVLKVALKGDISRNVELLSKAARDRVQVKLRNYRSGNSQSIKDRTVEPYAFSGDGIFVKCFEVGPNKNKTFKIERIGDILLLDTPWKFEPFHELEEKPDIFGINGGETHQVTLLMSLRAANLLKEEFPLSRKFIWKEDVHNYKFEANVNSFIGVSRFILGLIDEVEVLGPKELKVFLNKKIEARRF
ncbi:MAG: transcriptional regulator [Bacteroidia bacterium]|nr:transcriptional regulator [Bacteroidia bacterium]